jgi:hypothetical protein
VAQKLAVRETAAYHATTMFVRFRHVGERLQVSVVAARRVGGKVRHEHVASLGSVPVPQSVEDRLMFWQELHERLAKLTNRIGSPDDHARVLGGACPHPDGRHR